MSNRTAGAATAQLKRWTRDNLPDLTGQTWLVTGATSGIGLQTVQMAADKGSEVVLAVRDTRRGEALAHQLGNARVLELDLGNLASVRQAAVRTIELGGVDVLVNNAGASPDTRVDTVDGFEPNLGVNVLGPFLFTNLVLDHIRR